MKEEKNINDIREWDKNPRSITSDGFERLKKQLLRTKEITGEYLYKPLLITPENIVIGGNMRLKVLRELGVEKIWVNVVNVSSEAEMLEIALSDNDSAGKTEKDELLSLIEHYPEIKLTDYAVHFDEPTTLDDFMSQFAEIEEDEVPEIEGGEPVSKLGEVYQLGRHRLMCGDSTKIEDVEKLMNGQKADMVFTDPPYNIGYTGGMSGDGSKHTRVAILNDKMSTEKFYNFLYAVMSNLITVTNGAFYVCMSSSELHNLWRAFTSAGGHWQTYIIWAKDSFTLSRSDYQHQFEPVMYGLTDSEAQRAINEVDEDKLPIMYGWTKHSWYGGRKQGDVWRFDRPKVSKEHPTMKPVALCAKAIVNSSQRENIVIDVFGGSGSTLIACEQLDRTCYMMELDPRYIQVILDRWEKFTGQDAIRVEDGKKWKDIKNSSVM